MKEVRRRHDTTRDDTSHALHITPIYITAYYIISYRRLSIVEFVLLCPNLTQNRCERQQRTFGTNRQDIVLNDFN